MLGCTYSHLNSLYSHILIMPRRVALWRLMVTKGEKYDGSSDMEKGKVVEGMVVASLSDNEDMAWLLIH